MRPYTEDAEHKITSYGPKTMLYNCIRYLLIQKFSLKVLYKETANVSKRKSLFSSCIILRQSIVKTCF